MASNQQSKSRKMTSVCENTPTDRVMQLIHSAETQRYSHMKATPWKKSKIDKPHGFDQPLGIPYRYLINFLIWFILVIKGLMAEQHFYATPVAVVSTLCRCCTRAHTSNFYIAITGKTSGIEAKNKKKVPLKWLNVINLSVKSVSHFLSPSLGKYNRKFFRWLAFVSDWRAIAVDILCTEQCHSVRRTPASSAQSNASRWNIFPNHNRENRPAKVRRALKLSSANCEIFH